MDKPSDVSSPERENIIGTTSSQQHTIENNNADAKVVMKLQDLPPDVLHTLLSELSLKELVRMGTLSQEWRQLGVCRQYLVFNKDTFFGSGCVTGDANWTSMANQFVTNIDNILHPLWDASSTTAAVDKFAVKFPLRRNHANHIDKWIHFSIMSRTKHISLDFSGSTGSRCRKYIVRWCDLSGLNGSSVESLDLRYVRLKAPSTSTGIANLKKLSLRKVSINEDDLECVLLGCSLLEYLGIEECSLWSLSISQELSRLQHLKVRDTDLKIIELHAPNLTKFDFDDCTTPIVLDDSLKLLEATLSLSDWAFLDPDNGHDPLDYILYELPTAIPHVHKLLIHAEFMVKKRSFPKSDARFTNLRHVNLNLLINGDPIVSSWVVGLITLLELAPLLEELELHMDYKTFLPGPSGVMTTMAGPLHKHLRSVYISGFHGVFGLVQVALYILGNAIVLESMVVDPVIRMNDKLYEFYSVRGDSNISTDEYTASDPEILEAVSNARAFAKKFLVKEQFRHIVTIL